MKKYINYITITLFLGVFFASCEDPFGLTPSNIISENVVFDDENLVNAFLTDIYSRAMFETSGGQSNYDQNMINAYGGEARNFAPWQAPFGTVVGPIYDETGARALFYWPYQAIREMNVFIEKVPESSVLDPDFAAVKVAEARFVRAFTYFEMVKRYGGVPLATKALPPTASEDELYIPRNSEKEIYDFIGSEMDAIIAVLPSTSQKGRVNRWVALALKSRAMLYAASVAQFGTQQLDGLLGFPSGEANNYYQQSLAASNEILKEGPYSLYRKDGDPALNFEKLFIDENNNPETIFVEEWDVEAGKGHSWDYLSHPDGYGFGWGSNFPVYLETLEQFDFMDGTSGKVDRSMYDDATPIDPDWYFEQRDPRMRASIFYPGTTWRGRQNFYHRSTNYTDPADGIKKSSSSNAFIIPGSNGWPAAGPARNVGAGNNPTALQIRKRLDQSIPNLADQTSGSDFIVFRLGEIYLNYVEAAYYLGDPNGDMEMTFNELRDRASMPALSLAEITEDKIRQERRVELAFESHVFWDLRRWRIAVQELDGVVRHRMHFRYDYDNGTYTIAIADGDKGRVRSHTERNYYYAFGLGLVADSRIKENPGY
ncbi:RagB/SusD family nutrient uptake outer membrane protein [Aureibaculum sp. 2210JD6-5]|uniref:RagB/SusD family nutrient uptake outer membrane protein n=1 Tax=Aureibaculum sp. 2210JD6-5 TaxID=3103957 RepID=UPI002AACAD13|nr:RagB/SusD family nutrient uptake outer membrane protein [Aureibaculum sp. 2210JD6-5]MDY7395804.1 RagB/SusD family nutrient uptake outer membrane protein [Aureibaculum sp. 2210JD6-5]